MSAAKPKKKVAAIDTASPARNFSLTTAERIKGLHGPPAYARRKRHIEDLEDAILAEIAELRVEASKLFPDDDEAIETEVLYHAREIDLAKINDLIERHNRYYPSEANLPMDPRTGALLERGAPWKPLARATIEAFVERSRRGES
jgi:hypothetical protein